MRGRMMGQTPHKPQLQKNQWLTAQFTKNTVV
jgi:hypothetical protein